MLFVISINCVSGDSLENFLILFSVFNDFKKYPLFSYPFDWAKYLMTSISFCLIPSPIKNILPYLYMHNSSPNFDPSAKNLAASENLFIL